MLLMISLLEFRQLLTCNSGHYPSNDVCTPCPIGSSSSYGSTSCTPCAVGTANPVAGGLCVECKNGYYANMTGMAKCLACPIGSSSRHYYGILTSCSPCAAGRANPVVGGLRSTCNTGYYANMTGLAECLPCPIGSSSASKYMSTSCSPCGAGTVNSVVGGLCLGCKTGYYANVTGSAKCLACPIGSSSEYSYGSPYCSPCPAGSVNPVVGGACLPCKDGYYANVAGLAECLPCPAGTTSVYKMYGPTSCAKAPSSPPVASPKSISAPSLQMTRAPSSGAPVTTSEALSSAAPVSTSGAPSSVAPTTGGIQTINASSATRSAPSSIRPLITLTSGILLLFLFRDRGVTV